MWPLSDIDKAQHDDGCNQMAMAAVAGRETCLCDQAGCCIMARKSCSRHQADGASFLSDK